MKFLRLQTNLGLGKPFLAFFALMFLAGCAHISTSSKYPGNDMPHHLHHVVIIWLKQAGDQVARQRYIDASRELAELPGVLVYSTGSPAAVRRTHPNAALDESYDVAVSSVFESAEAFEAFLRNPEYLQVAQQVLRPLVERYKVYDFEE